jgi:SAM-dependent methyltransferase
MRRWDKSSTVRLGRDIASYLASLHRFRKKIGLSYLGKSPVYWNGHSFDLIMRALYGKELRATYAAVAARIPDGASVVDLCCGTARLYRDHLEARGCSYLGLDFNSHFVLHDRKRGVHARFFNVLTDPIPAADCVTMLSSLYHFRRAAREVLTRMRAAARKQVIISEPVKNLSGERTLVARAAARLSNPGVGEYKERFDLAEFKALAQSLGAVEFAYREGEQNAVAVFGPLRGEPEERGDLLGVPVMVAPGS